MEIRTNFKSSLTCYYQVNHCQVLGIVAGVLLIDHDVRGTEFQQVGFYTTSKFLAEISPKWSFRSPIIASSSCCSWSWTRLTRSLRLSTSRLNLRLCHLWHQLHLCTIFLHVLNLLVIGVDRLLQHALHSPPSQGGELQPNYVDHVPHHMPFVLSPRTLFSTIWSHNDPNRLPDLPTPG